MEVLLCARDEVTGFFRKSCCYGDCKACDLRKVVAQCDLDDIKDNVPAEDKCRDLFVFLLGVREQAQCGRSGCRRRRMRCC